MKQIPLTPHNEYLLALGTFHHCYTDVEHQLTCLVRNMVTSGVSTTQHFSVIAAVLGSMRMQPAKDTIKRLMRALAMPSTHREAVDKTFAHLGDIQFLRDRLAHHFTSHDDGRPGTWINDDFAGVREMSKWTTIEFTPAILHAASTDLIAIKGFVDGLFGDYMRPEIGITFKKFDPNGLPTWQYKPVVPAPQRPKRGDSA